jgi:hypothetical protein
MPPAFPAFMMGIQLAFPLMASQLSVQHSEICKAGKRRKDMLKIQQFVRRKPVLLDRR